MIYYCLVRNRKQREERLKSEHKHNIEALKTEHKHKNELGLKTLESLEENVTDLGDKTDETAADRKKTIERIKKKLDELKELMKQESIETDNSEITSQVDLKNVDECLKELLSRIKTQQGSNRVSL